jgi:hypothetical protein
MTSARYIYKDWENPAVPIQYIYRASDLGDAITHIEVTFKNGYLVRRIDNALYEFIPVHRIISAWADDKDKHDA